MNLFTSLQLTANECLILIALGVLMLCASAIYSITTNGHLFRPFQPEQAGRYFFYLGIGVMVTPIAQTTLLFFGLEPVDHPLIVAFYFALSFVIIVETVLRAARYAKSSH